MRKPNRQKAAEDAKRKAESDAKAKQQAADNAKRKAEADAKAKQQKAAEDAKRKAEADAKAKQQKAAEDAKRKAEADAKAKQQKAAEDAKRKAEADAKAKQQKAAEDARRKAEIEPKKKLHLLKKLKKKLPRKKVKLKKLHLRLNVILSRKFVVLGMFLQEAVVKLLALDLPCLTQVVLARLLLHGQVEMMHWMQVSKLQFRRLLPTQCHRILMQDEKREALPLLSEHNNFVRVTCFK
jgi:colicin import membrane protein